MVFKNYYKITYKNYYYCLKNCIKILTVFLIDSCQIDFLIRFRIDSFMQARIDQHPNDSLVDSRCVCVYARARVCACVCTRVNRELSLSVFPGSFFRSETNACLPFIVFLSHIDRPSRNFILFFSDLTLTRTTRQSKQ